MTETTQNSETNNVGKRLAITLNGGGSLGAYEAGVLYELLRALKHHNKRHLQNPTKQIHIDVLTGASAGAINCMLLSFLLSYSGDTFKSAKNNALFEYWVTDAYMFQPGRAQGLLGTDEPEYSLLNSDRLGAMAETHFARRYGEPFKPDAVRHPAAADSILIGMTLANMSGLDFKINYERPVNQTFTYTRYEDEYVKLIAGDESDDSKFWERVLEHAAASGAFPYGLRCRDVVRSKNEYSPELDLQNARWPNTSNEASFAYCDGGLFHNQPLGLARSLAKQIDKLPPSAHQRFFLYISPWTKKSSEVKPFRAQDAKHLNLTVQLLKSIMNQSRYQDWISSVNANQDSKNLSALSSALLSAMHTNEAAATTIVQAVLTDLQNHPDPAIRTKAFEASNLSSAEAMTKLFAELAPSSASDEFRLYAITPNHEDPKDKLCGEGLLTFQGFFRESYRLHDYALGRKNAINWLSSLSDDQYLGPIELPGHNESLDDADQTCEKLNPGERVLAQKHLSKSLLKAIEELSSENFLISAERFG